MNHQRIHAEDLKKIYFTALDRCRPAVLVQRSLPRRADAFDVIALGKCAAEMVRGVADAAHLRRCFVAVPREYATLADFPDNAEVHFGSHPELSDASFEAGSALLEFARRSDHRVLALISGGSSTCVEQPLAPWFTAEDLVQVNAALLRSGWPIAEINTVRKHLSAIKGGRLGSLLRKGSVALVLSDVNIGQPEVVGSGPTYADQSTNLQAARLLSEIRMSDVAEKLATSAPETPKGLAIENRVIGDNATLVSAAAGAARELGWRVATIPSEIIGNVQSAAETLITANEPGAVCIAGGEPTVKISGGGRGGRCFEVAARIARLLLQQQSGDIMALCGSSDGRDGNSGAAGCVVSSERVRSSGIDVPAIESALADSDTFRLAEKIGEPIIIPPTGNNLRDLFLLTRT